MDADVDPMFVGPEFPSQKHTREPKPKKRDRDDDDEPSAHHRKHKKSKTQHEGPNHRLDRPAPDMGLIQDLLAENIKKKKRKDRHGAIDSKAETGESSNPKAGDGLAGDGLAEDWGIGALKEKKKKKMDKREKVNGETGLAAEGRHQIEEGIDRDRETEEAGKKKKKRHHEEANGTADPEDSFRPDTEERMTTKKRQKEDTQEHKKKKDEQNTTRGTAEPAAEGDGGSWNPGEEPSAHGQMGGHKKKKKKDGSDIPRAEFAESEDDEPRHGKKKKKRKEPELEEAAASQYIPDAEPQKRKKKKKQREEQVSDGSAPHEAEVEAEVERVPAEPKERKKKKKKDRDGQLQPEPAAPDHKDADPTQESISHEPQSAALTAYPRLAAKLYAPSDCPPDPDFPFFTQTISLRLPLNPAGWDKPISSAESQHLKPLLNRYDDRLGGVLLDYRHVALGERPGRKGAALRDEDPTYLTSVAEYAVGFGWVTAETVLFVPTRGAWMEGELILQSEGHVGVVCWNKFNASIEARRLPQYWHWVHTELAEGGSDAHSAPTEGQGAPHDETGSVRQMHPAGYWADGDGTKISGRLRFRIQNFDVSTSGDHGFLSLEGTLLSAEEEDKVQAAEREEEIKAADRRGGVLIKPKRALPEFGMTKFGSEEGAGKNRPAAGG